MEQISDGVWRDGKHIYTLNLAPGFRSFSEELVQFDGKEYRQWDPLRSKAAAAIHKGLNGFPLKSGQKVLYLGIANGNTASFFSDIVGPAGMVYGIEISQRAMHDLIPLAEKRKNIAPIVGNAKVPDTYAWVGPADILYQDIATNDQSEVFARNAKAFLAKGGMAMIAIKSRSIDVIKEPKQVFKEALAKLEKDFEIVEKVELDPLEKDHLFLLCRLRPAA